MNKRNILILFTLLVILSEYGSAQTKNGWTIMYYAAGSNSSETYLLNDIGEMIRGKTSEGYEVISLIDRIQGFSEDSKTLGENFTDTRLYRFHANAYEELNGHKFLPEIKIGSAFEANMGDADLLKRFIQYCKSYYPAEHYLLVLRSHGNGLSMCPDNESDIADRLYTAELKEILTHEESVDILGLDVCSMAGLENFYEWRPDNCSFSADYILASAPLSAAWAYDKIFNRLQADANEQTNKEANYFGPGNELNLNPFTMTPVEFSTLLIEEIHDSQEWASWGLFDNSKIIAIKSTLDGLAKLLALEDKSTILKIIETTLGYHHNTGDNMEVSQLAFPYIDAFDFMQNISNNKNIKIAARKKAEEVALLIDGLVVHSYYGRGFLPDNNNFREGKHGVYLIAPIGNKVYSKTGRTFWSHTGWFHPDDKRGVENSYGLYDWCSDGAVRGNNKVDNFFEYLDFLFDESNTELGGVNGYQW